MRIKAPEIHCNTCNRPFFRSEVRSHLGSDDSDFEWPPIGRRRQKRLEMFSRKVCLNPLGIPNPLLNGKYHGFMDWLKKTFTGRQVFKKPLNIGGFLQIFPWSDIFFCASQNGAPPKNKQFFPTCCQQGWRFFGWLIGGSSFEETAISLQCGAPQL